MKANMLPLLNYYVYAKKKDTVEIFKDKCFVIVLHFLRDLIPFLEALVKLGAKPENCWLIAKPYPYPYKKLIGDRLSSEGFKIVIAENYPIISLCRETLHNAYLHSMQSNLKIIIIEDGGHIAQHISEMSKKEYFIGAIEQTMKGYWKYKELMDEKKLFFPVLSVASSRFKSEYEPRFIGKAIIKNIRRFLPDMHLSGKKALVFGFGSIGSMVSYYLKSMEGMVVDVCEVDPKKRLLARFDNYYVKGSIKEFGEKDWTLVVGCTGGKKEGEKELSTIDEDVISSLPHGCILVSGSSDQIEIDMECLSRYSQGNVENIYVEEIIKDGQKEAKGDEITFQSLIRRIKIGSKYKLTLLRRTQSAPDIILLADGYPINFFSSESVPNESIDPIMTTIFLSTVYLARNYKNLKNMILEKEVDDLIKEEIMLETFIRLHGLQ